MKPALLLRAKLEKSEPVIGVLIAYHLWLGLIESCHDVKLDYAIIDAEHFTHDSGEMADACAWARMAGFPLLVRPPSTEPTALRLAMDLGPCGLLLPMIDSASQLDEASQSLYLPPRGERRPGGPSNSWISRYDYQAFRSEVEDTLIVVPQIESAAGLKNVREIAAHPLSTAVGVGPFDLSARLGICGDMNHPRIQEAHEAIRDAASAVGKKPGPSATV